MKIKWLLAALTLTIVPTATYALDETSYRIASIDRIQAKCEAADRAGDDPAIGAYCTAAAERIDELATTSAVPPAVWDKVKSLEASDLIAAAVARATYEPATAITQMRSSVTILEDVVAKVPNERNARTLALAREAQSRLLRLIATRNGQNYP